MKAKSNRKPKQKTKQIQPSNINTNSKLARETFFLDPSRGYKMIKLFGSGTFGAVFLAQDQYGRLVSVKKVIQDFRYKNRELDILQKLEHPNCLYLEDSYITCEGNPPEYYLHLITKAFPMDLSTYIKNYPQNLTLVKIFAYQLFTGISYLHSLNICLRDIKSRNILLNEKLRGKIGDFGLSKIFPDDGDTHVFTIIAGTPGYVDPQ